MARRDRVPRLKSHNQKRNKNPKLSPFQREQKRAKLANQAPTLKSLVPDNDIPRSQRQVYDYLLAKRQRDAERRQRQLEEARQQQQQRKASDESATDTAASSGHSPVSSKRREEQPLSASPDAPASADASSALVTEGARKKKSKKARREGDIFASAASLNAEVSAKLKPATEAFAFRGRGEFGSSTAANNDDDPDRPRTVEEIIARKKAKKHAKRVAERNERVTAQLQSVEEELKNLVKSGSSKRKNSERNAERAFERELVRMQKEKARSERAEKAAKELEEKEKARKAKESEKRAAKKRARSQDSDDDDDDYNSESPRAAFASSAKRSAVSDSSVITANESDGAVEASTTAAHPSSTPSRKTITFDDSVQEDNLPHRAMRFPNDHRQPKGASHPPRDFYELVDVVRFGERVEAPPVFDVVPNKNAAVSRLATKLEREQQQASRSRRAAEPDRHRLLASVGGLGEQKRLARLGLAPAITSSVSAQQASKMSKEKEMELLRASVMATYQRNKRSEIEKKKGVDMKHVFPSLS